MSTQEDKPDKPARRSLEDILREAWLGALGSLERRVDDGVRHAFTRLSAPVRDEIAALNTRLDRLAARLDEQARRHAARRPGAGGGEVAGDSSTKRAGDGGPDDQPTDGTVR